MVRTVLVRLHEAGVLTTLPRAHTRAPQYYEADPADPVWDALSKLADAIIGAQRSELRISPGAEDLPKDSPI